MRVWRDVLAERIASWIDSTDAPYDYVDRLILDLDAAGYEIMPSSCLADGCTNELGAYCEDHGFVLYGRTAADVDDQGRPVVGQPHMERGAASVERYRKGEA